MRPGTATRSRRGIVDAGAAATAALVMATVSRLQLGNDAPLALAGGIACSGEFFRNRLLEPVSDAWVYTESFERRKQACRG